jgi:hypothetical protein
MNHHVARHRLVLVIALVLVGLVHGRVALAGGLTAKDVVGSWALDADKSKAAADGNTAGVMKKLTIKDDGTFETLVELKGTWRLKDGKLLVTWSGGGSHKEEAAAMDGEYLKFPAPAMTGKFCYVKRAP